MGFARDQFWAVLDVVADTAVVAVVDIHGLVVLEEVGGVVLGELQEVGAVLE